MMKALTRRQKNNLLRILSAGVWLLLLMVLKTAEVIPAAWYWSLPFFLIPYLLVGWDVIWDAVCNLFRGQLLDENFLMALATVGALVIGEYPEAVFVMLFYQVGELFQSIAVGKSRRSIAELMNIRPDEARVLRDGAEVVTSPEEVAVGDMLIIRPGEKIPLDGIILHGESEINKISLTGESAPEYATVGDAVISGCINKTGLLEVCVTKPYGESTVAKILELVEHSSLVKSRAESAVTKFAHWYTPLVVLGALLLAIIPSVITGDWQRYVYNAMIFLVVSCPCALVISVPLSYFGGLGAASRHGVLVKGANYLEALATPETIVFDKTGTLTHGEFSVAKLTPAEGVTEQELLMYAAAAEKNSNHPISRAVFSAYSGNGLEILGAEEIPGHGVAARLQNGETVHAGNYRYMKMLEVKAPLEDAAGSVVYVAVNGQYLGRILVADRIKSDAKTAIARLKKAGVSRIVMLTGDRAAVAASVAGELEIDEYFAELLPADKVKKTEQLLQSTQKTLVFVGDGVNDAPVLARADVGIAMGGLGSDAAIEAADMVLMKDEPTSIAEVIEISRFTHRVVWQNIVFALGVKLLFLILGAFGLTNLWLATFSDVGVAVIAILNAMRVLKK